MEDNTSSSAKLMAEMVQAKYASLEEDTTAQLQWQDAQRNALQDWQAVPEDERGAAYSSFQRKLLATNNIRATAHHAFVRSQVDADIHYLQSRQPSKRGSDHIDSDEMKQGSSCKKRSIQPVAPKHGMQRSFEILFKDATPESGANVTGQTQTQSTAALVQHDHITSGKSRNSAQQRQEQITTGSKHDDRMTNNETTATVRDQCSDRSETLPLSSVLLAKEHRQADDDGYRHVCRNDLGYGCDYGCESESESCCGCGCGGSEDDSEDEVLDDEHDEDETTIESNMQKLRPLTTELHELFVQDFVSEAYVVTHEDLASLEDARALPWTESICETMARNQIYTPKTLKHSGLVSSKVARGWMAKLLCEKLRESRAEYAAEMDRIERGDIEEVPGLGHGPLETGEALVPRYSGGWGPRKDDFFHEG